MRAISAFILEAGTSTVLWRAMRPLRRRVSRSAMGSVMLIVLASSPARLRHPGERSLQGQVPETDPADLELSQVAAGTPAAPTPGVLPYHELAGARRLCHPRLGRHLLLVSPLLLLAEGHAQAAEERPRLLVGPRRGH